MRCENKTFLQNDPGFLQEISSTAVEVGLGSARPLFHLPPTLLDAQVNPFVGEDLEALVVADLAAHFGQARARHIFGPAFPLRSEERRVGKECRSRCSTADREQKYTVRRFIE